MTFINKRGNKMIEKLNDFKVNLTSINKKFNTRSVVAVEMKKVNNSYYKVDEYITLGEIDYNYKDEMKDKMRNIVNAVSRYLDLNNERLIFEDTSMINIERNVVDEDNSSLNIEFYGFYEMSADRVFMLSFEREIDVDTKYLVIMNIIRKENFRFRPMLMKISLIDRVTIGI